MVRLRRLSQNRMRSNLADVFISQSLPTAASGPPLGSATIEMQRPLRSINASPPLMEMLDGGGQVPLGCKSERGVENLERDKLERNWRHNQGLLWRAPYLHQGRCTRARRLRRHFAARKSSAPITSMAQKTFVDAQRANGCPNSAGFSLARQCVLRWRRLSQIPMHSVLANVFMSQSRPTTASRLCHHWRLRAEMLDGDRAPTANRHAASRFSSVTSSASPAHQGLQRRS